MLSTTDSDLINLLDDSVDQFFSNEPLKDSGTDCKAVDSNTVVESSKATDTILNEEITAQNLPASPPFTKVSAIKIYTKASTPLRPVKKVNVVNVTNVVDVNENSVVSSGSDSNLIITSAPKTVAQTARKDHTKSFLPRIKKRQKQ